MLHTLNILFTYIPYEISHSKKIHINNCSSDFIPDNYEIVPGSCMSVRLHALRAGFSTLTVSYQYKEIQLKATVTIGAYYPLQVLAVESVFKGFFSSF